VPVIKFFVLANVVAVAAPLCAQQQPQQPDDSTPPRHILWVIPNFRTTPELPVYTPIRPKEKFRIATQDTFDRGTVALAALFATQEFLSKSEPSFGQGIGGYAHYWATSYADFALGNFMTEGVYPTLLHQDPRYFRRGRGTRLARLGYAAGSIFWTRTDSGGHAFNFSEVGGNATAVAISMAYLPNQRTAGEAVTSLSTQLGVDMAANILKEFWPAGRKH
jgi:hypothetical protein